MRRILSVLLILVLSFASVKSFSQETQDDFAPFLAKTLKKTTLKAEPDNYSRTKLNLPLGSQLYVFSENDVEGFLKVIDIRTNKLGYVPKTTIKKVKDLPLSSANSFEESGQSSSSEPEVFITNSTSLNISLIVGNKYFSLRPHSSSTETIESGDLNYTASAPSVLPFQEGIILKWVIDIIGRSPFEHHIDKIRDYFLLS